MSWIPDPCFRIYLMSIHKDKHGSDSGIFDTEGRFIPSRFEDMWVKVSRESWDAHCYSFCIQYTAPPNSLSASADKLPPPKDMMTYNQLWNFIRGNRVAMDPFGWTASFLEWSVAFLLLQKDGMLYKEDVRMLLDGSIFFKVKAERESKRGWNQGFGLGGDGFFGEKRSLPFSI
jgi:peroxygenase